MELFPTLGLLAPLAKRRASLDDHSRRSNDCGFFSRDLEDELLSHKLWSTVPVLVSSPPQQYCPIINETRGRASAGE